MKKILYLCITACVILSCQKEDENDVRNPLPTITVVKVAKVRQGNVLSTYNFEYDMQRRISKIIRVAEDDVTMTLAYNSDNQVESMTVDGEGTDVGTYRYVYDEDGRLKTMLFNDNTQGLNILYNQTNEQYYTVNPNYVFAFFESMDFKRSNTRNFQYDLANKGPVVNTNSSYHFLSLLGPDPNFYFIMTKRPITIAGPTSNPDEIAFVNTFSDKYVIKSVAADFGLTVDFSYGLID